MKSLLLFLSLSPIVGAATWVSDLQESARLRNAGQVEASERIYRQILNNAKSLNAPQLNALGIDLAAQGRDRDAEWAYRRSLEEWDRLGLQKTVSRSTTAANLGILLQAKGRYSEAEPVLLDRFQQADGNEETARAARDLAALYLTWGHLDEAESFALRSEALFQQPAEQIASRRLLASTMLAQGRIEEGSDLLRALLKDLPDRSAITAYNDLATVEIRRNQPAKAESLVLEALELARRVLPAEHEYVAVALNNLAQCQRFQGRYLQAEKNYRQAIDIWKHVLGAQHPDLAKGLMNLAAFYHERGREAGAEDLYRQARAILETAYGKDHTLTLIASNELGEVLRAQRRFAEAEKLSRATVTALEMSLGDKDPRVIRALENYARLLEDTRRASEAASVRNHIHSRLSD